MDYAVEYRIALPAESEDKAAEMSDKIDTAISIVMREIGATWVSAEIYTY